MNLQDLADTRCRLIVEGMEPAVIHFWAAEALEDGADTPALRKTAAADVRDVSALQRHFKLALDELGAPQFSGDELRWQYVRYYARAAIEGEIDATGSARRIVWGAAEPLGWPERLQPFVDAVEEANRAGADEDRVETVCMRLAAEYLSSLG